MSTLTKMLVASCSGLVSAGAVLFAQVQGAMPGFIGLQSTTPGTTQVGHGNISGAFIAGDLRATDASRVSHIVVPYAYATATVSATGAILKLHSPNVTGILGNLSGALIEVGNEALTPDKFLVQVTTTGTAPNEQSIMTTNVVGNMISVRWNSATGTRDVQVLIYKP